MVPYLLKVAPPNVTAETDWKYTVTLTNPARFGGFAIVGDHLAWSNGTKALLYSPPPCLCFNPQIELGGNPNQPSGVVVDDGRMLVTTNSGLVAYGLPG